MILRFQCAYSQTEYGKTIPKDTTIYFNTETQEVSFLNFKGYGWLSKYYHRTQQICCYANPQCSKTFSISTELDVDCLIGETIREITGAKEGSKMVTITTDNIQIDMFHPQECCETVYLLDVSENQEDLIGEKIVKVVKRFGEIKHSLHPDRDYCFYEIQTNSSDLTFRWGEPNESDDNRYGVEVALIVKLLK